MVQQEKGWTVVFNPRPRTKSRRHNTIYLPSNRKCSFLEELSWSRTRILNILCQVCYSKHRANTLENKNSQLQQFFCLTSDIQLWKNSIPNKVCLSPLLDLYTQPLMGKSEVDSPSIPTHTPPITLQFTCLLLLTPAGPECSTFFQPWHSQRPICPCQIPPTPFLLIHQWSNLPSPECSRSHMP